MSDITSARIVSQLDWNRIRENVHESLDGEIRPASWEEMTDAINRAHPDWDLPMGIVERAATEGVLNRKGEGLNDEYTFNPEAFEAADNDGTAEDDHILNNGRQYAPSMVARDSWILYEDGEKQVKAPWKTGTLYNAEWGMQLDPGEYPETEFEVAQRWAEKISSMDIEGGNDVNEVYPGYLLQRELLPPEQNIAMIDLDDCRDPQSGEIIPEARHIIERANSYTEISMSGTGVHIFVFGRLPDSFPSHRLVEPMHTDKRPVDEVPKVEIYHRRRVAITTGNHLEGTPEDVENGQEFIANICSEYYDDDRSPEEVMESLSDPREVYDAFDSDASNNWSPYFEVDPVKILPSGGYRQLGGRVQGPHPHHGSTHGSDYQSGGRNFAVEDGFWACYRHGSGGNALHLVAVMEGFIECEQAGSGSFDTLTDEEFASLCLTARDDYAGFAGRPPYRALLGIAKVQDLAPDSAESFDSGLYDLLLQLFKDADATDISDRSDEMG